jgi:hypothetical protein
MTVHISFVVISDCLKHDTIAMHLFQSKLCGCRSGKLKDLTKIYYFITVCCHKDNFGTGNKWPFFATSHGRGACSWIGGTMKRLVRKASLQNPYEEQVTTPKHYEWTVRIILVTFVDCAVED